MHSRFLHILHWLSTQNDDEAEDQIDALVQEARNAPEDWEAFIDHLETARMHSPDLADFAEGLLLRMSPDAEDEDDSDSGSGPKPPAGPPFPGPCAQADFFAVPLLDGRHMLGQVIDEPEADAPSVYCLLTLRETATDKTPSAITLDEVIARVYLRPEAIGTDLWPILGFDTLPSGEAMSVPSPVNAGDTDPIDAPAVEAFLNACTGQYPWDGFPDRAYFDGLLVEGASRPDAARMTSEMEP